MFFRLSKEHRWLSLILVFFLGFFLISPSSAQNTSSQIHLSVASAVPNLSLTSDGADGLFVSWNWNHLGANFFPANVVEVRTEISSNGILYTDLVVSPANDFVEHYTGLAAGTYTARVTVMDGNDYDYLVGPVNLAPPPAGGGGGGGRSRGLFSDVTDVTLSGLAYPGPSAVVIFTYEGGFETLLNPGSSGTFSYQTAALPVGSGTFSFSAKDPDGILSVPVIFDYDLPANTPVVISTIHLPPTIHFDAAVVTVGEIMNIRGYAYQDGSVSLLVNGPDSRAYLTQASTLGAWNVGLDTSELVAGTYEVVAQSTSATGGIVSPNSETLIFELVTASPAAPVCGNALVEAPEQCDDGDALSGDGCSALCQVESGLPQSEVQQPSPAIFADDQVLLEVISSSPTGTITSIDVYYSRNGAAYERYPTSFTGPQVELFGLTDGDYEVYSVASDSTGAVEPTPAVPDATFVVDGVIQLNILAYPEKRSPSQGNWSLPGVLTVYAEGQADPVYSFDVVTDDQGRIDINAESIPPGTYTFLFKGLSHLSKRLDRLSFRDTDLLVDFTLGGSFYLIGGDTSVIKDDYINALDFSSMILRLYTALPEVDLNHDGMVNGMDLGLIESNLYKQGDGAPL